MQTGQSGVRRMEKVRLKTCSRAQICWKPDWNARFGGWARQYLVKNKWRLDPIADIDDLLQDAFLIFHKCVEYYPRVRHPAHFMSLFKSALENDINSKATIATKRRKILCYIDELSLERYESACITFDNEGPLLSAIRSSPVAEELIRILDVFNDPDKLISLRGHSISRISSPKYFNRRLSELAGLDKVLDLAGELRKVLDTR